MGIVVQTPLAISTKIKKDDIVIPAKLGVHGYLVKPFDVDQFIEKVSEILPAGQ